MSTHLSEQTSASPVRIVEDGQVDIVNAGAPHVEEPRVMDFNDITPTFIVIKYRGKEYVLREAGEDAARRYKNVGVKSARLNDGKLAGLDAVADAESLLVHLCLFEQYDVNNNNKIVKMERNVPLSEILRWPHRVIKPIYKEAIRISDLIEEEETEEALRKRIAELNDKLTKVVAAKGDHVENETDVLLKNAQHTGTESSVTATN